MSGTDISRVLSEMRALQARISDSAGGKSGVRDPSAPDFASLLRNSVDQVAQLQNTAQTLATSYESGDKTVDLTKVMLEVQKASLAFRAMTEVRNKLVDAYTQIMNMPV